ncbi:MAG: hypothetical protein AB7E55_25295 [Pigmentiphaga sp.]
MAETFYAAVGAIRAGDGKFDSDRDYLTARSTGYGMAGGVTWFFTTHDSNPGARYSVNGYVQSKVANTAPSGSAAVTLVEPASTRVAPSNERGLTMQPDRILITGADGRVKLDTDDKLFVVTDRVTGSSTPVTRDRGDKGVQDYTLAGVTAGSTFVAGTLTFTNPVNSAKRWMNAGGTFVSFWAKNTTNSGPSVNAIRGLTFMVVSGQLVMRDNYNNGQVSNPVFGGMAGNLIEYNLLVGRFV